MVKESLIMWKCNGWSEENNMSKPKVYTRSLCQCPVSPVTTHTYTTCCGCYILEIPKISVILFNAKTWGQLNGKCWITIYQCMGFFQILLLTKWKKSFMMVTTCNISTHGTQSPPSKIHLFKHYWVELRFIYISSYWCVLPHGMDRFWEIFGTSQFDTLSHGWFPMSPPIQQITKNCVLI